MRIPLPSGRVLSIPLSLGYSSAALQQPSAGSTPGYVTFDDIMTPQNSDTTALGGWSFSVPHIQSQAGVVTDSFGGTCDYTDDYVFYDPSGGATDLYLGTAVVGNSINTDYPCSSVTTSNTSQSGHWYAQLNGGSSVTITGPDGTVYFPGAPGVLVRDSNGNEITEQAGSNGGFSYTDTVGRPLVAVSSFDGSGGDTIQVSGVSNTWKVAWKADSFGYSATFHPIDNTPVCNPGSDFTVGAGGTVDAISSITLPNGQSWSFSYDPTYGTLQQITAPGGGYVRYVWAQHPQFEYVKLDWPDDSCEYQYSVPVLTDRYVSADGNPQHEYLHQHFDYAVNWNGATWSTRSTTETDTITNPVTGTTQTRVITHNYLPGVAGSILDISGITGSEAAIESSVQYKDDAGAVQRTVSKTWANEGLLQPSSETLTLENNDSTEKVWCYNANNQVVEEDDYGLSRDGSPGTLAACATAGVPSPVGPLLHRTVTTWADASDPALASARIVDRPAETISCDDGSQLGAETDYSYDAPGAFSAAGITEGRDSSYNGNTSIGRGDLTSATRWTTVSGSGCSSTGTGMSVSKSGALSSSYTWDDTGQLLSATDPAGNKTTYTWGDAASSPISNTGGFLNQVQYPDTSDPNLAHHIESYTWDYATGEMLTHTGQNGNVTSFAYNDLLNRLTQIVYPAVPLSGGGTANPETDISYGDTPGDLYTEVKRKIDTSGDWTDSYTLYDGLGRAISHSLADPDNGFDRTDTTFDGAGRVVFRSYPCAATAPTGAPVCTSGDSFAYDVLNRPLTVTHPDGSQITTSYTGAATEIMDEGNTSAGPSGQRVTRILQHDGLGRLVSVCEVTGQTGAGTSSAPAACNQDIAGTGFLTSYQYDTLGNLTQVDQGAETRSFTYDSLSRLLSADNPEAGVTTYGYDADSNVATRTRPAPNQTSGTDLVTTNYTYDPLNRLRTVTYPNDTSGTPVETYDYDEASMWAPLKNTDGRMSTAWTGSPAFAATEFSYDAMGWAVQQDNCPPGDCGTKLWNSQYTYDLLGDVTGETLPQAHSLNYTWNQAGRLTSVQDAASGSFLLQNVHYSPWGESAAAFGNGMNEARQYNGPEDRLSSEQVTGSTGTFFAYGLTYAPDGDVIAAQDNGNANGNWSYVYGPLNRLTGATCGPNCPIGASTLQLNWVYDRYGNRWQQNVTQGSAPTPQFTFSNGDNRIDGWSYDAAGDLLSDGTFNYTYDAEGRLTSAVGNGQQIYYQYDALGHQVHVEGTVPQTVQIYDAFGHFNTFDEQQNLIRQEVYAGSRHIATWNSSGLYYSFADWLGTERARTDAAGNDVEGCTSLPFGDDPDCWEANGTDISPLHFTGKPRDPETGLDNFGARYNSSQLGRFMTPDWSATAAPVPYAKLDDPQSLNLYSYAGNNPVTNVDANGHCFEDACVVEGLIYGAVAATAAYLATPSGQRAERAAGRLVTSAVQGISHTFEHLGTALSNAITTANEQQRDAQGKFLPVNPGQTKPGSDAERAGLGTVGATPNTKPIPGSSRIPDGKTDDGQYVEVKSGQSVSNTQQLREMGAAAVAETGRPLVVVTTDPNVKVSDPAAKNPNLKFHP